MKRKDAELAEQHTIGIHFGSNNGAVGSRFPVAKSFVF
jgi:hypothetical protein